MKLARRVIDAALCAALGLFAPAAAEGSVDAGTPDAGAIDGDPVALYGVRDTGCGAAGGAAVPGAAVAALTLLKRRRSSRR